MTGMERFSTCIKLSLGILSLSLLASSGGCSAAHRIVEISYDETRPTAFDWQDSLETMRMTRVTHYGQARASITPPFKTALAGYGGLGRRLFPPRIYQADISTLFCRPFQSVESDVGVKVHLFEGEGSALAPEYFFLVNLDLVAVTQDVSQWLLELAQSEFPELNLNQSRFQVTATHTHSGPAGLSLSSVWSAFACDSVNNDYRRFLSERYREALKAAWNAKRNLDGIRVLNGKVANWNKSRIPGLPVSEDTFLLQMASDGGNLGCMYSFPVHATLFGPNDLDLSADYPGLFETQLEKDTGTPCTFLNGNSGNAKARRQGNNPENYIKKVLEASWSAFSAKIEGPSLPDQESLMKDLTVASTVLKLPNAKLNLKACGAELVSPFLSTPLLDQLPRASKLSLLRMGNFAYLFVPGELVSSASETLKTRIRETRPELKEVFVLNTSNDYNGYILDGTWYNRPSLEACSSLFGAGHLKILLDAATLLAREMGP